MHIHIYNIAKKKKKKLLLHIDPIESPLPRTRAYALWNPAVLCVSLGSSLAHLSLNSPSYAPSTAHRIKSSL